MNENDLHLSPSLFVSENRHRLSRSRAICVGLVAAAILSTTGCGNYRGIRRDLATTAVTDYNAIQADVQIQLLARNILRAKERQPRHFTGLGAGQVAQTTTTRFGPLAFTDDRAVVNRGSATVPDIGGFGLFKRNAQFGMDLQSTPRIDLSALDSREFVTGMTSTVRYDVLHYFQRQGWAPHLMMMLFVRELQLGSSRYINNPSNAIQFATFRSATEDIARAGLELRVISRRPRADELVGPGVCLSQASLLEHQVAASAQGLRLFKLEEKCPSGEDAYGLGKQQIDNVWSFDACKLSDFRLGEESGLGLMARAQIARAWSIAMDEPSPPNNTQTKIDSRLKAWRSDYKAGQNASVSFREVDATLADLQRPNGGDAASWSKRYRMRCNALAEHAAILEGLNVAAGTCTNEAADEGQRPAICHEVRTRVSLASTTLNARGKDVAALAVPGRALLRSPESIIYYLGQVVRTQQDGSEGSPPGNHQAHVRYWTNQAGQDDYLALMTLRTLTADDVHNAVVTVEHDGKIYGILRSNDQCATASHSAMQIAASGSGQRHGQTCFGDRSMSVLNAVLLLIGLQRSANDLPTTPTVNVIGG